MSTAGLPKRRSRCARFKAYVYDAKLQASRLARLLGDADTVRRGSSEDARLLKQKFVASFWCEELGTYAIALDGNKQQCRIAASNAGHALWSGIADDEHAARVVKSMMSKQMFCGWGIRTVGSGQPRYNPMSYHNGSVWPHDNALVAAGMARYGHIDEAMRIMAALYEASLSFDQHRLPELFCGFPRRDIGRPHALSGCLFAAGLGGGSCLRAASGLPRHQLRTRRARRSSCAALACPTTFSGSGSVRCRSGSTASNCSCAATNTMSAST